MVFVLKVLRGSTKIGNNYRQEIFEIAQYSFLNFGDSTISRTK